jgi:DNA-binding transcriptional regulator GbsR (MarR family)
VTVQSPAGQPTPRPPGHAHPAAGRSAPGEPAPGRDPQDVRRFIERFASALAEGGVPRMPARVFAGLLATDSGCLTATELADLLQVSPAAISGAVRYLALVDLVSRERRPGSRRDVYCVHDDVWTKTISGRNQLITRWENSMREGVEALGPDTPAGRRLAATLPFFEFLQEELTAMLTRWLERAGP